MKKTAGIIVVFIISYLLSVAVRMVTAPRFYSSSENANPKIAMANYRQYISATHFYITEHKELPSCKEDLVHYMVDIELNSKPQGATYFVGYEADRFVVWVRYKDIYEETFFEEPPAN